MRLARICPVRAFLTHHKKTYLNSYRQQAHLVCLPLLKAGLSPTTTPLFYAHIFINHPFKPPILQIWQTPYLPLPRQDYLHFRPSAHYQTAAHHKRPPPLRSPYPLKTTHSKPICHQAPPGACPCPKQDINCSPRFFLHLFSFFCTLYKLHIQTIYPPSATCSHLPRQGFLSSPPRPAIHFAPPCTFHLLHSL